MITVEWPSCVSDKAEVWRVLDLSGLTNSVRESRNFLLSGFIFVDNYNVKSPKYQIFLGKIYEFEIRFPNGKIISEEIYVVSRPHYKGRKQRTNSNREFRRKG